MRNKYMEQLDQLHTELVYMGALCEDAISEAMEALFSGRPEGARKVLSIGEDIKQKEKEIENLCLKLLLQQQPVATDLREISAALKLVSDMERIGDQAADISEIVLMGNLWKGGELTPIREMSKAASNMVSESIDAYVKADVSLAEEVMREDDKVDDYFNQVKHAIITLIGNKPEQGEYAVDLLMVAKYLERIGDHAVAIAGWVEFAVTGRKGNETKE